jgi:hypothetical protein
LFEPKKCFPLKLNASGSVGNAGIGTQSLVASRETNFENKERKIRNESWKQVLSFAINVLTQRPLNANVFIDYDDEEGGVWYAHR